MDIKRVWRGCKLSNENGELEITAQEMLDIATYVEKNRLELNAVIVSHDPNSTEEEFEEACAYLADVGENESLKRAEEAAERYFTYGSTSSFIPID